MAMHPDSAAYMKKFGVTKPMDVFKGKFDYRSFLQAFLFRPQVMVNDLHPIVALRLCAAFVELMLLGYASPHGPNSVTFIRDGVRLKGSYDNRVGGSQWWFWARDLQRLGRKPSKPPTRQPRGSGGVANPEYERGQDCEGITRRSSNHVSQKMPAPWNADVGYAIDLGTTRGRDDAAWAPIHKVLKKYGLEWPLKAGVSRIVERWHHQAQGLDMCWYPGPWPERPGVHRPLITGFVGGDVATHQANIGKALGMKVISADTPGATPAGAIRADGDYGPTSTALTAKLEAKLARPEDGVWDEADQIAFEGVASRQAPKPPVVKKAPPLAPRPAVSQPVTGIDSVLSDAKIDVLVRQVDEQVAASRKAAVKGLEIRDALTGLKGGTT